MLVTKPEALKGDVGEPNKFLGQTPGLRRTSFSGKPRAMRVLLLLLLLLRLLLLLLLLLLLVLVLVLVRVLVLVLVLVY